MVLYSFVALHAACDICCKTFANPQRIKEECWWRFIGDKPYYNKKHLTHALHVHPPFFQQER